MLKCERLLEPMLLAYVIIIAFSIAFYLGIENIYFASFKYIWQILPHLDLVLSR